MDCMIDNVSLYGQLYITHAVNFLSDASEIDVEKKFEKENCED